MFKFSQDFIGLKIESNIPDYPLNNIKMVHKKPTWNNNCTHCMACIGNCPVEAIGYGKMTDVKTPYNIGKYKHVTDKLEQSSKKHTLH